MTKSWLTGWACALLFSATASAVPGSFPTGTTWYDPLRAWNGYVLFPGGDRKTHLIDMNGNEVNRWDYESFPPWPVSSDKGHLLVQLERQEKPEKAATPGNGMLNAVVGEVDWYGNEVWRHGSQRKPLHQHHDIRRLDNGNTLIMGAAKRRLPGFDYPVIDNNVEEVTPEGKTVWRWWVGDHLDQLGFSPQQIALIKQSRDPDFLHFNTAAPLGENHWFDVGDRRFAPDNILVNSRNGNVAAIIDKKTNKVVWRIGPDYPPLKLGAPLPRPLDQIVGAHDVHMIGKGLPGAGNLLIFDNQGHAGFPPPSQGVFSASRVIEVNPKTRQIVWEYSAQQSGRAIWSFYSAFISNAQRLPNGNTLINEGQNGRFFQVTPRGRIVWEYVSPWFGKQMPKDSYVTNSVYRARMVDYRWAPAGTPHSETPVMADCKRHPAAPGCAENIEGIRE
ncbi:ArsR family transcriptional regulator [Erwinia sp. CPCC 100877]|nr:ArsR family transcriptional regulator [Erwinia sp. CPCC 100877]